MTTPTQIPMTGNFDALRRMINAILAALTGSGATSDRPTDPFVGQPYFDTTLDAPVWWDGGKWIWAGGGGGGLPTRSATAAVDLTAGQFVNLFSSGGALAAQPADSTDDTKPADGFVLAAVSAGDTAAVNGLGQQNVALSGLTPGATYYLGTDGAATATAPSASGNLQQALGKADSATTLTFTPQSFGVAEG